VRTRLRDRAVLLMPITRRVRQATYFLDAETLALAQAGKHGALTLTERIVRPCWRAVRGSGWPCIGLWLPHLLYK
jgi:hypothetical protein